MSSNFRSIPTSLSASRTGNVSPVDLSASLLANESGAPQGQDFASWMAQHREGSQPPTKQPLVPTPTPQGSAIKASLAQQVGHPIMADKAVRPPVAQQVKAPAPNANKAQAAKAPDKSLDKAQDKAKAADQGSEPEAEQGAQADAGKEVKFKTAQGEASTWVKELQPPPELSTSDPAAMLAWLASLTQADSASAAVVPGEEGANAASGLAGGKAGKADGADAPGGGQAAVALGGKELLTFGALGTSGDADASGKGRGEQDKGSGAVEFSALMSRETTRLQQTDGGPESSRHYTGSLATPVESPQFAQALADRVGLWISGPALTGPMTAELRLNPAELGPVHIRIELDGQNAMVDFAASNEQTRGAIEASLPLLSGALEDVGLSLTGGGVSDQGAGQSWGQSQDDAQGSSRSGSPERPLSMGLPEAAMTRSEGKTVSRPGGLDLYA